MMAYEFFGFVPFGAGAVVRVLAEGAVHGAQQVLGRGDDESAWDEEERMGGKMR